MVGSGCVFCRDSYRYQLWYAQREEVHLPSSLLGFMASQNIVFIFLQDVSSYFSLFSSTLSSSKVRKRSSDGGWLSKNDNNPPEGISPPDSTFCLCILLKT
mmetsp:Transcript_6384/g.13814  ORF Transcript_6384/g.13814 Transcript_6384/m.13814 type:complete len:101 (+) Transcript_6384:164-466(+)